MYVRYLLVILGFVKLFTIGYEGLTGETFFALLQDHDIETIVDVRELPLSRKRGFSKSALAMAAMEHGISYQHLAPLGCPRPIRNRYRADGDWNFYTQQFLAYLEDQETTLDFLAGLAQEKTCCLLCFEADANFCHRLYVAQSVQKRSDLEIVHLTATTTARLAFA